MIARATLCALAAALLAAAVGVTPAAAEECALPQRTACFGVESVQTSLASTEEGVEANQAGAHPDLRIEIAIATDPLSPANVFGEKDSYAATRDIRIETPPGLIGDPNALGTPQQCSASQLVNFLTEGCPNGSQVGISTITAYDLTQKFREPLYMMAPPGGDVVARLGTIAGIFPTFIDLRVRSEHQEDFGLTAEVTDAPAKARLIKLDTTLWGVPASPVHDEERCTPAEVFNENCVISPPRDPSSNELPFLTNPTRCGAPLGLGVNASSWLEPELIPARQASAPFEAMIGCGSLPFGPSLSAVPTAHRPSAPSGLEMTIRLPAAKGVKVLEPSQTRDIRIDLPQGVRIDPGSAEGLGVCSPAQARFEEDVAAECPDSAKMASTEFEVAGLPRRLRGAVYLREPEPGNLFRIWVIADDLGAHVKLPGQLEVDKASGQIKSVLLDNPQVPLREAKLSFKSGFRAPLLTPPGCGTYSTHYDFTPWSGGPDALGDAPMSISEGCGVGGFSPSLSAGSTDASGGVFAPFAFTIASGGDTEQNLAGLGVTLPRGMAASFAGIPRCEGAAAESGHCPAASRIGRTTVADGVGPNPLWVPQPGKDPTAVYLGGPYEGAPFSIVAVVPAQAGPFDLGLEVVRSAVFVDPETAQATARTDPLPQFIEGIPILYKTINVVLDQPGFSLNPTSCQAKQTTATLLSTGGASATPTAPYQAVNCSRLGFKPKLFFRLRGGTSRGAHPSLRAVVKPRPGGANFAAASVALPHSEFLDQSHIGTVCTRVQFAAHQCPPASIYGHAVAKSPLFDQPLSGPVYLRSSNHLLPDVVAALRGPDSLPIEVDLDGSVDSIHGGIRNTFEVVPDAPVSSFVLTLKGGKKGLLENSTSLCAKTHRATAKLRAQNGRSATLRPALKADCGKG